MSLQLPPLCSCGPVLLCYVPWSSHLVAACHSQPHRGRGTSGCTHHSPGDRPGCTCTHKVRHPIRGVSVFEHKKMTAAAPAAAVAAV
eukprot:scaffold302169_cov21-Tisochrysis_lutea.AAC.1